MSAENQRAGGECNKRKGNVSQRKEKTGTGVEESERGHGRKHVGARNLTNKHGWTIIDARFVEQQ
jgi:hypothetical protein